MFSVNSRKEDSKHHKTRFDPYGRITRKNRCVCNRWESRYLVIQGPGTVSMEEWIDDLRSGRGRSFANPRRLPSSFIRRWSWLFISATTMNTHTHTHTHTHTETRGPTRRTTIVLWRLGEIVTGDDVSHLLFSTRQIQTKVLEGN